MPHFEHVVKFQYIWKGMSGAEQRGELIQSLAGHSDGQRLEPHLLVESPCLECGPNLLTGFKRAEYVEAGGYQKRLACMLW